ncbi:MAG: DUF4129 domain-containing protein [bacterium]|nr:DUF4129 domain-containing protein [bacterium]
MIPLVLFIIGFVIYALVKLWPALKGLRLGMKDRLVKWLEKLRELLRLRRKKKHGETEEYPDPQAAMEIIGTLPPREAIITAYNCLLAFLYRLGHKRIPRLTPYEYLSSLPEHLDYLDKPARRLTDFYVRTVYGTTSPTKEDGKNAADVLFNVQLLIDSQDTK